MGTSIREVGGPGVLSTFRLRQAQCVSRVFPSIPFAGMHVGHSISRIARITTEQQKIGLTLFREALSSNKVLLSFLLSWQIMEIRHSDPVRWINETLRRHPQASHRVPGGSLIWARRRHARGGGSPVLQDMVDNWRQHHARNDKEHATCEQRIHPSKPLSGFGMQRIHGFHTAEKHGCVQESARPRKSLNPMIHGHPEQ